MSDIDAVLFANEVFYVSFASGDVDAMDELWSSQAPISCIHPGWESLSGREDVVGSWRSIIEAVALPQFAAANRKCFFTVIRRRFFAMKKSKVIS